MSSLKENNRNSILSYIYKYGPSSRKTIADTIGITQAAVGKICKDLIDMGLIYELGAIDSYQAGRREVLLEIDYKRYYCIGVNIFRKNIVVLLTNIKGESIKKIEKSIDNTSLVDQVIYVINELIKDLSINKEYIMGVGISGRGKVNPEKGIIYLPDGEELNIRDKIESETGIKTYLDNNVRNLMIQEISLLDLTQDTIFIKWGPGLGASSYINESIVYGSSVKAGEIGKIPVKDRDGKFSTLEDIFSEDKIVYDVMENFNKSTMPVLNSMINGKEDISIENIIKVLNYNEHDYVENIIMDKIEILLDKINIIDSLCDVKNIILYGKIFEQDNFFDKIQTLTRDKFNSLEGKIKKSQLKQKNECYSPIYLVISNIFI